MFKKNKYLLPSVPAFLLLYRCHLSSFISKKHRSLFLLFITRILFHWAISLLLKSFIFKIETNIKFSQIFLRYLKQYNKDDNLLCITDILYILFNGCNILTEKQQTSSVKKDARVHGNKILTSFSRGVPEDGGGTREGKRVLKGADKFEDSHSNLP